MKPGRNVPRTWVVPNRNTIGLAAVLIGMWWAGVSQSNAAAYLLCFVLAAVALISTAHAWANVTGVTVEADTIRPVFAGEDLKVPVRASSTRFREHFGIRVAPAQNGRTALLPPVPREGSATAELRVPAPRRGVFAHLDARIESHFPIGFFTARRAIRMAGAHCVYPAPEGTRPMPAAPADAGSVRDGTRTEGDDFGGVRAWRAGESQRHIDWKAVARGQPLLIRQWSGDGGVTLIFDWDDLPDLAPEPRLSQLAQWIVQAEREGHRYGLRLPAVSVAAARGDAHCHACLRHLAEFSPESSPHA